MRKQKVDHVKVLADQLIEQIKTNTAPWQKPWEASLGSVPYNALTEKPYRGYNILSLVMRNYDDPRWLTFKQAKDLGYSVKKGEKGTPLTYYNYTAERTERDENGKVMKDSDGNTIKTRVTLDRPVFTIFYAFNAEQIDGIPPLKVEKPNEIEVNARAEALLTKSGAEIHHKIGDRAYYSPNRDHIVLPMKEQFKSAEHYYSTALHELGHWSGHESRLDRGLMDIFGSKDYAREELRAEISSMMVGQEIGIRHDPDNHIAYAQSWIKLLEDDPKEILYAARDAQKIFDYVMQFDREYAQKNELINDVNKETEVAQIQEYEEELER